MALRRISTETANDTTGDVRSFTITVPPNADCIVIDITAYVDDGKVSATRNTPALDNLTFDVDAGAAQDVYDLTEVAWCKYGTGFGWNGSSFVVTKASPRWPGPGAHTVYINPRTGSNFQEGVTAVTSYYTGVDQQNPAYLYWQQVFDVDFDAYLQVAPVNASRRDLHRVCTYRWNATVSPDTTFYVDNVANYGPFANAAINVDEAFGRSIAGGSNQAATVVSWAWTLRAAQPELRLVPVSVAGGAPDNNDLTSSITATFGVTADLTGAGTLASTVSPSFSVTSALTGAGALTSSPTAAYTVSAELTGAGTLASSIAPAFSVSSDLTGLGTLSSTISPAFSLSASLTAGGSSELTSTILPQFSLSATLTGAGSLSSTISPAYTVTSELTGQGTLSSTISPAFSVSADLTGAASNDISATVLPSFSVSASLTGAGTLSSTVSPAFSVSAILTEAGNPNMTSAVTSQFTVSANLTGVGTLTSAITSGYTVSPALTGAGVLSSTISPAFAVSSSLSGIGALTSTISPAFSVSGAMSYPGQVKPDRALTGNMAAKNMTGVVGDKNLTGRF